MSTLAAIALRRLANQFLLAPKPWSARQLVAAQGAVQAQDYAGAKWGIALRVRNLTDASIEDAMTEGAILRTHVMRPTWHFVAPEDIRWLLALTAPRVRAISAHRYRELELDDAVFRRSHAAIANALQGGRHLTRAELRESVERARIDTRMPQRLAYLLMRAELDGLICSGPRRGKQFTYALLEERVRPGLQLGRDDALRELVIRYFTTRGPATPHDFSWWSGLTVGDARRGLQMAGPELTMMTVDGTTYWMRDSGGTTRPRASVAHLLPNYDEYFIGFRDRSAIGQAMPKPVTRETTQALSAHIIVIDGQVVGGWKRSLAARVVTVELNALVRLTRERRNAIETATRRLGPFLEQPVEVVWASDR